MISRFFIDRPIFAIVLSLLFTLAGGISVFFLPIALYPPISPPMVQVTCAYPGANAKVVSDTVGTPIEQLVNGVDHLLYMQSQSTNDGNYALLLTFDVGADINLALVQVQNRVQLAMPLLPNVVRTQGVNIKKKSPDILLSISIVSPDGRYDDLFMSNYATIHLKDELLRVYGVGDLVYLGQRDYSIRAWLDPEQMASRGISADQVNNALKDQNTEVISGSIGQAPTASGQANRLILSAKGRLKTPEEFGNVIIKVDSNIIGGAVVRLKDIARIELGAQLYDQICQLNGMPSVGLMIFLLPGTNALNCADAIRKRMEELSKVFPPGLEYKILYDTSPYISDSIEQVALTLRDAILLVALVVLLFLQNWRATLIPLIAVPVAVVGTFAIMGLIGFSLNTLSLFGLVLSIGIVVDDAIVVVENVERLISQGLSPRDATIQAMDEVTGPVIGVALVLSAVFIPCAFIGGVVGLFFKQFALTIAVSTILSAINSLTLSPAMARMLLKPHGAKKDFFEKLLALVFGRFFSLFNRAFDALTKGYGHTVGFLLKRWVSVLVLYGIMLIFTIKAFGSYPMGFVPLQDQGYLLATVTLDDGASVQRTNATLLEVDKRVRAIPGVKATLAIAGQSFLYNANSPNWGSMFIILDDFKDRTKPGLGAMDILLAVRKACATQFQEASVGVYPAPPVKGLGTAGGFKFYLEDRGNLGNQVLQDSANDMVAAMSTWGLPMVRTDFNANMPQIFLDINREKLRNQGIALETLFNTLQTQTGSMFINNFNLFSRYWQLKTMAAPEFRAATREILNIKVPNSKGDMVPISTLLTVVNDRGPAMIMRYNLYPAAPIAGIPGPTSPAGTLIAQVNDLAKAQLPDQFHLEWSEIFYLQIKAGNTAVFLFLLGILLVFLVLAALYESWTNPFTVILLVPLCLLSAMGGLAISHLPIDILAQVGLVVLVGLACKNAILIVEYARDLRHKGMEIREATRLSCKLRFRPIIMTSLAFILGVFPLVVAQGAGAEMRRSLGITVFAGMIGVTLFGTLLTPVFYQTMESISTRFSRKGRQG